MRLVFAVVSLLLATPALAGGAAALHVGLVVTGDPGSPVLGAWTATSPVHSGTYHFEIGDGRRLNYQVIAMPSGASAGCDIHVSAEVDRVGPAPAGMIQSFHDHHYLRPDYVVRYSITSAVATADLSGSCDPVAAAYASKLAASGPEQSLVLTRGAHGELIDSVAGTEFARATAD